MYLSATSFSDAVPLIGSGRVYGTSASRAPSSTIRLTSRLWHTSRICSQNVRQRMLGSIPRISTTSRSVPGGLATLNRVVGHSILRASPSAMVMVGLLTWKS
nr:hypothetical protein GCM10020092_043960 [Actinoplanes digitatis]